MSVDELELLIGRALVAADQQVDARDGRARLAQHLARQRAVRRRLAAVAVAALLLTVGVAAPVVLAVRDHRAAPPVRPAPVLVTLSPSGLPVGLLTTAVRRSAGINTVSTVRFWVHPDGTGQYSGSSSSGGVRDGGRYDVQFVAAGQGRVVMRYPGVICANPDVLTLDFAVRAATVVVTAARSSNCLVSRDLANNLAGATLEVRPLG